MRLTSTFALTLRNMLPSQWINVLVICIIVFGIAAVIPRTLTEQVYGRNEETSSEEIGQEATLMASASWTDTS